MATGGPIGTGGPNGTSLDGIAIVLPAQAASR
jgi:hypothetical protein